MGLHFPNGALVGDGVLDPMQPEVLVYEPKNGKLELAGVEYLEGWQALYQCPPALCHRIPYRMPRI